MKTLLLAGVAALSVLSASAAHARTVRPPAPTRIYFNYIPPPEFDKPYTGKLIIRRFETEEEIERMCKGSSKYACAPHSIDLKTCYLFILNDSGLRRNHIPWAFVLRHELGHCNGWSKDHENKRKVQMVDVKTPPLPPDTTILPQYPPVVCVTPEWKQEPCKDRNNTHSPQLATPSLPFEPKY